MHIKFLAHGTGNPRRAAEYLTGTHDSNGVERAEVRVLRGNPGLIGELAASLKTVHRYTSGVIAWNVEDSPTDEEIDKVLSDFEVVAFAGLEPDQYAWCAILHVDQDGSRHVHVFAARVELRSGRAFNLAPPGWETSFDPLRDAWNFEKGWARPDDPLRARLVQPGPLALASRSAARRNQVKFEQAKALCIDASDIRDALAVEPDQKREIADSLMRRICAGLIDSRKDLLDALAELGEINRVSANYVSIRLEPGAKPVRLKGTLFSADFDADAIRRTEARPRHVVGGGREAPNPVAAQSARRNLAIAVERRAAYNRGRYPAPRPSFVVPMVVPAPTGPLPAAEPHSIEVPHDRTRNPLVAEALRAFGAARNAVRSLIHTCRSAVATITAADQASGAIERASRAAERAGRAVMTGRADELERFKREVNLPEFAQSLGYEIVKKESSRACTVMKSSRDKIVVTTATDGHGVYFSVGDERDSGSVIDFAQHRLGGNIGQIRKELRGWISAPAKPSSKRRPEVERPARPEPIERDRAKLLARWTRMTPYAGSYLAEQRGLDPELIAAWRVRQDERGNALFAHHDAGELCGWESKNAGFTGFASGGKRGLAFVRLDKEPVQRLVVAEASIDAMSWAQIHGRPAGAAYVSLGGEIGSEQLELIQRAIQRTGAVELVLATDADDAGDRMAQQLAAFAPSGVKILRARPVSGKDWNDELRAPAAAERYLMPVPGR